MLLTAVSVVLFVSSGMLTLQLGFRNAAIRFFAKKQVHACVCQES